MSLKSHMIKVLGVGAVITALSAGAALAAVATSTVNVRSGPSTSYSAVDQLFPGEVVGITGHSNGWCSISHPGRDGWVNCAYLSTSYIDRGPRYFRPYDRFRPYPYYGRGPSFGFSVGPGGFGFGVSPRPHHHWW